MGELRNKLPRAPTDKIENPPIPGEGTPARFPLKSVICVIIKVDTMKSSQEVEPLQIPVKAGSEGGANLSLHSLQ